MLSEVVQCPFGTEAPTRPFGERELDVAVDASWSCGLAAIAYTSDMIGSRVVVRHYPSVDEAEMGAVLLAMNDARTAGHSEMVLGTDNRAAALVDTLAPSARPSTRAAATEIRSLLEQVPSWRLIHVPRASTRKAHALAVKELRPWRPRRFMA